MGKLKEKTKNEGQKRYEDYWAKQMKNPKFREIYEEESAKKELWLQLVEARQATGLTQRDVAKHMGISQTQVASIEERGYEEYTLKTLRRYLQALGDQFCLEVVVTKADTPNPSSKV